jgi:hypothetical protein
MPATFRPPAGEKEAVPIEECNLPRTLHHRDEGEGHLRPAARAGKEPWNILTAGQSSGTSPCPEMPRGPCGVINPPRISAPAGMDDGVRGFQAGMPISRTCSSSSLPS